MQLIAFHFVFCFLFFAGAVVAKKKMMKKYGWYKHSEDGGTELSFTLIFKCIAYQTTKRCNLIYF